MERRYSFTCDYATTDKVGKTIVIGIFEKISPLTFPYTHPQFIYVACIKFDEQEHGKHQYSIEVQDNNGEEISAIGGSFDVVEKDEYVIHNFIMSFTNVTFSHAALYKIILKIDSKILSTDFINITKGEKAK